MKAKTVTPIHMLAFILFILALQATFLWLLGQPLICTCGYVKLWEGVVLSKGNSQHLTDWYTFTHIIHGMLYYLIVWIIFPNSSVSSRFLIALGVESFWEVIENTPWAIEHYRQQALAVGYSGDSVINSISDSLAMIIGFVIAYRFPWWLTCLIALVIECWLAYEIRDNLTLNVLNLIYVFPAIHDWQSHL